VFDPPPNQLIFTFSYWFRLEAHRTVYNFGKYKMPKYIVNRYAAIIDVRKRSKTAGFTLKR
jgi:hypothetical protein